ncbi:arrestin domain-containing protein 3-like [Osmerus mordax]|uniref:arrestin domain-containing protein 3-like n=1 Tax=Osmerus mordax TaxID=8014 RepID=UPI003510B297
MVCCLWCASGPVAMTARLDRKGYVPGETIKIMCEFSNASTRNATPTASLMQHEKYSTLAGSRKVDNKSLDSATGELVKSGNLQAYSEMSLTIPDTTFLSVSNCSIIEVVYTVLVTLSINWSSDVSVSVPIVICDIPVDSPDTDDFEDCV